MSKLMHINFFMFKRKQSKVREVPFFTTRRGLLELDNEIHKNELFPRFPRTPTNVTKISVSPL